MTRWTVGWLVILAEFFAWEIAAYLHGGYRATATGHLVAAMGLHGLLFVVVPLVFVGVAVHLWADAIVLRLK